MMSAHFNEVRSHCGRTFMDTPAIPSPAPRPAFVHRLWDWLCLRPGQAVALAGVTGLIVLPVLFYTEENWRGKRAWEKCKQQVEAKGRALDWAAYIPAPVPGDQNFFAAPGMAEWFTGRGMNDLSRRLSFDNFHSFLEQRGSNTLAELTVVPIRADIPLGDADIVLRYDPPILSLASAQGSTSQASEPSPEIIPLIIMDEVPLTDVIKNLARQENLNYVLDPSVPYGQRDEDGKPVSQPFVSARWTDVTAHQALMAVLNNYNLQLVPNPKTGIARIKVKDPNGSQVSINTDAREKLLKLLQDAIGAATNGIHGPDTTGAQLLTFTAGSLNPMKPVRIFVRADTLPASREVADFFPANLLPSTGFSVPRIQVEPAGSNSFLACWNSPPYIAAADYLTWSDQFAGDFDAIREALKRPYARMDGDYENPVTITIPNFVCVRMVTQTLAQRAQCHLLLGCPEPALRDLMLIRDMCRLMEGRPSGKPMTLVAAMINVAVTGLYVSVVADGLRLQVWREPELVAIQKQLGQIDLPPYVAEGLRFEQASSCRILETVTNADLIKMVNGRALTPPTNQWQQLTNSTFLLFSLVPRGWIYHNMANIVGPLQREIDSFDLKNHIVQPDKMERASREVQTISSHPGPYSFMAAIMLPNFVRAVQTAARNQTLANEALIVCALERYRLAHGEYPETLDALAPRFIQGIPRDIIGGQPLKYRREKGEFVLYSVGWNQTDDGGVDSLWKDGPVDIAKGDWVWPYRKNMMR
jgi:hypothetical protein